MSRDMIGGAIVAAGVWAVFAVGIMGFAPLPPRGHAWAVTGSEMILSHPILVRISLPSEVASASNGSGGSTASPKG